MRGDLKKFAVRGNKLAVRGSMIAVRGINLKLTVGGSGRVSQKTSVVLARLRTAL